MSKLNNEIECPYYQYAIVNEDGDDFYDLCYGAEKGEYCCDEENKNCLYRQLQQLKVDNEELKKGIVLECPQCGGTYLNKIGCELYEEKQKYKQCLDEIEKLIDESSCECWHTCNDDIRQKINEVMDNDN